MQNTLNCKQNNEMKQWVKKAKGRTKGEGGANGGSLDSFALVPLSLASFISHSQHSTA